MLASKRLVVLSCSVRHRHLFIAINVTIELGIPPSSRLGICQKRICDSDFEAKILQPQVARVATNNHFEIKLTQGFDL